ncbi:hypothetical protein NUU61_008755 [Penicillium alfredii]|uniref:Zn(2)-C6 fungal-type domain-containing protein n=1 Tax=Penicillium alfredii TaxID=1506179 RepID=A0A9W9EM30_9EURO|nr:uncharacterized protein NUU61_008755 [Penicillium alfredii]KAJ5084176.1 hypothetical protein NUU61_008755 [Penicillium alfredii]
MPGVPSSRGCDSCRQQKKKCDLKQPVCTRCTRLHLKCVGSGQQRYKFKEQPLSPASQHDQYPAPGHMFPAGSPARSPSNESTMVAQAFVSALQVTDLRYNLSTYGTFLYDIPRRLGSNAVLDAAANVMGSAFPFLHARQYPPHVLVRYGRALRTLRTCLDDPVEAPTPNTLCAIYLIIICQGWLGKADGNCPSHGQAIAHLLRAAVLREWTSTFEADMVLTLCLPVILESIANPSLRFDPTFWDNAMAFTRRSSMARESSTGQSTIGLRRLAKIPDFLRFPDPHLHEITATYQRMRDQSYRMRHQLAQWSRVAPSSSMEYARYRAAYCILVALAVTLNSILGAFDPSNSALAGEAAFFCEEIATTAELASCHRPLGAGYASLCLVAAWAAVLDPRQLARIEGILLEYQTDFPEVQWFDRAVWLRTTFANLRQRVAERASVSDFEHSRLFAANEACVVL